MSSKVMEQIREIIDAKAEAQPTPMEFELAYQARIAMDRIRFAIKHTEQFAPHTDPLQEVGLQLLDALQRLETAERRFQERSRIALEPKTRTAPFEHNVNGCANATKDRPKV
jgi:hypothetical protein